MEQMKFTTKRCSIPGCCLLVDAKTDGAIFSLQMPTEIAEYIAQAVNSHKDLADLARNVARGVDVDIESVKALLNEIGE